MRDATDSKQSTSLLKSDIPVESQMNQNSWLKGKLI